MLKKVFRNENSADWAEEKWGQSFRCLEDVDHDRADAPVEGGLTSRHPDVDMFSAHSRIHPIFDHEDLVAIVRGDFDAGTEW